MAPYLLTVKEAAERLRVPAAPLERAARAHGLLARFGRRKMIREHDLEELVAKCLCPPEARTSPSASAPAASRSGSFATPASVSDPLAQATSELLKPRSRPTSPRSSQAPAPVVPFQRTR